jgi:hypothetical protein
MKVATQVVEVMLPEGVSPTREELDRLRDSLQAVVAQQLEQSAPGLQARLEAEGWKVSLRVAWCAEARRGHDYENAVGRSPEEALAELSQLTRLDVPPGGG